MQRAANDKNLTAHRTSKRGVIAVPICVVFDGIWIKKLDSHWRSLGSPYTRVPARPYRTASEGESATRRAAGGQAWLNRCDNLRAEIAERTLSGTQDQPPMLVLND